MSNKYKMGLTLLLLLLLLVAQQGAVDRFGMHYTESGFNRALLTFAVARSLNGVISVAQGTEVAIQPAGVGINFTPGQILDPVNDLIERFSWVMLVSTTSLGLQKVLLQIFSSPHFTALLLVVMLGAIVLLWRCRAGWEGARLLFYRGMLLLLVLRFAVPLVALGSELLFTTFLQQQYESSTQSIERARDEIGRINHGSGVSSSLPQEQSLLGRAREWYKNTLESIDFEATLEQYQQAAANVSEQLIQLVVIFVLQTVAFPLLFLWGIGRVLGHLLRLPLPW
jgi:NADH:ubiquinone oxidoreductase subunit 3 (subunit A)